MSAMARLLLARGIRVTGSDLKDSPGLDSLRRAGATVFVGHRAEQVGSPDAVVVSSAIPSRNVELAHARQSGTEVLMRAQVLGALTKGRRTVAVAGTHGKTTTTSMISVMLTRCGLDPSFLIGGDLNEIGSGAGHGSGDVFVVEADESDGSFLLLTPEVGVLTNVEEDHLDFYGSRERVEAAFRSYAANCGRVVACLDDPGVTRTLRSFRGDLITYGFGPESDVKVESLEIVAEGSRATVALGQDKVDLKVRVPGRHNLLNAAGAVAAGQLLGVPAEDCARALSHFSGVRRRFDERGSRRGVTFVDDYAHHPTELRTTLDAARSREGRIVAVFQPHRYTRTQAMWRALGESLSSADVVVLTDVYGAGEPPIPGVTGKLVVESLAEAAPGKRVVYLPRRTEVGAFLAREVRSGDVVITLGAGDITMVGEETMERLAEEASV